MSKIWVTSDLHFGHNRSFIYESRGFSMISEMNEALIENWNSVIDSSDYVYLLGDIMLGDNAQGIECLKRLNGNIHIVLGNHDTLARENLYKDCPNVVKVELAARLRYKHYRFFMTHFPCITSNIEKETLKQTVINLYGHTHQKDNFYQDIPTIYHVGVDSHNCFPITLDQIIEDIKNKTYVN